ncbi:MAG: hypothetical protein R2864_08150 [Syntrophotaleaceae bacterium]
MLRFYIDNWGHLIYIDHMYQIFPPMAAVFDGLGRKGVEGRLALCTGSYSWSGGAQKELDEIVARRKMNWCFLAPVEFRGAPGADDLQLLCRRSEELARQVKESFLANRRASACFEIAQSGRLERGHSPRRGPTP